MMTAEEIRKRILDVVLANGGHLASSLGAVEISMALAETFDPMRDRVIWDVGHQAYAWKILTGRNDAFETLRKVGGVSPFPNPAESKADAAVAGHAGSALSVALGYASARDRKGTDEHVVAVIGDGSIVNGHSFEALNNCAAATKKVIVILNDNGMAISKPAGSFSRFLGRLITGTRYNRYKAAAEAAGHKLRLTFLRGAYHAIESRIKGLFLGNRFFEGFGLRYIGPVDGHDLKRLKAAFAVARDDKRSVIVHVVTKKGKGYEPAEKDPTKWHGIAGKAKSKNEEVKSERKQPSWSSAFGAALAEAARADEKVVALTAGMIDGTGLAGFAREFPERCVDVGIAEGHMVGFAAGLAAGGLKPVVAVYSTFLQRAIDQVIHDVAIANLPVVFCIDRAGVVGADGVTHQGLYDIALLRAVPNLTICQPKDADDLRALLHEAFERKGPTVIRYPRGCVAEGEDARQETRDEKKIAIWATGDWLGKAQAVAERVGGCEVVHARYLKPFDARLLTEQRAKGMKIVSLENGCVAGGFGEAIGADVKFGWPDRFIPHGAPAELEQRYGLDVDSIVSTLQRTLTTTNQQPTTNNQQLFPMAIVHGKAGEWARVKGTVYGLWPLYLCAAGFGFSLALIFFAGFTGSLVGAVLLVASLVAAFFSLQKGLGHVERYFKGARGEERVSGILQNLPDSYHVFNDFVAGGKHIDHVVVGPAGVFAIETKFWRGKVTLEDGHILLDGQLPDHSPLAQVTKEASLVKSALAKKGWTGSVTPVLAFASDTFEAKIAETQGAVILNSNHLRESFATERVVIAPAELVRLVQLMETNA